MPVAHRAEGRRRARGRGREGAGGGALSARTIGVALLALALLGPLAAAVVIGGGADVTARTGRHLLAGALALATLSLVSIGLTLGPLRRGERWAWWAVLVPIFTVAMPIATIDALFVRSGNVIATVGPQAAGITAALVGLFLTRPRG